MHVQAVFGWLESLGETTDELTCLDRQGRRERLQRLGVEVTVSYTGAFARVLTTVE